jgi:hypothetical protein
MVERFTSQGEDIDIRPETILNHVLLGTGGKAIFAADGVNSNMCDNGVVKIGDQRCEFEEMCGISTVIQENG